MARGVGRGRRGYNTAPGGAVSDRRSDSIGPQGRGGQGGGAAARGGRGRGVLGSSGHGRAWQDITWGGMAGGSNPAVFSSLVPGNQASQANHANQANRAFGGFSWEPVPVYTLVTRLHRCLCGDGGTSVPGKGMKRRRISNGACRQIIAPPNLSRMDYEDVSVFGEFMFIHTLNYCVETFKMFRKAVQV